MPDRSGDMVAHGTRRSVLDLTGTMVEIARGRRPLDDIARLLGDEPGVTTSPPAPAQGLFLHRVEYAGDETSPTPSSTFDTNRDSERAATL